MTLAEARLSINRKVVYRPFPDSPVEEGVITSVGERWVFVRYGNDSGPMATRAEDLELVAPPAADGA